MPQEVTDDNCINEHAAATLLGLSVNTLRSWRSRNRGPAFLKLGARVLYRRSAISRFLDDNEHPTLDSGNTITDFQPRRRTAGRG